MKVLFDFIEAHLYECIALLGAVISVVFNLIMFARTRNVKYLKEVVNMKYYTEGSSRTRKGLTFSNLKPVYRLNKSTGLLEETDEVVDIQAEIDSMRDYCLQACLARFEAQYSDEIDTVQSEFDAMQDDCDTFNQVFEVAERYRSQLGLSDDCDISDIFAAMNKKSDELKIHIQSLKDKNKGVSDDETKKD